MLRYSLCSLFFLILLAGCQPPQPSYFEINTREGRMVVRLYDETPIHRDNFRKLVAEQYFDSTTFHRVIAGFMVQGGDPNSKDDDPYNDGRGGPEITLEAEFNPELIHKRGALAAARLGDQMNPERRSNGSQFYIVQGTVFPASLMPRVEQRVQEELKDRNFRFSEEARRIYTTEGGAPMLDMQYTVFGELVEGFDVLDRIANTPTPQSMRRRVHPALAEQPIESIPMTIRALPDYGK